MAGFRDQGRACSGPCFAAPEQSGLCWETAFAADGRATCPASGQKDLPQPLPDVLCQVAGGLAVAAPRQVNIRGIVRSADSVAEGSRRTGLAAGDATTPQPGSCTYSPIYNMSRSWSLISRSSGKRPSLALEKIRRPSTVTSKRPALPGTRVKPWILSLYS